MGIITDIKSISRTAWSELLNTSPTATWFQCPEAYDFYASLPEMMTPFVVAVTNDAQLRAICVGYVTKERNPLKQFFTRRAIIIGGPCFADDCSDEEVTNLLRSLTHSLVNSFIHSPIYIETRNFNDYSRWRHVFEQCGFKYYPHYDMHINCTDRESMIARITDSKIRQIRKAENEGVQIVEAETEQEVHDFYVLLNHLYRKKVHRPLFPESFFQRFVEDKRGVLLIAKQNGAVIGGMLCPILEAKVIYEWYVVGPAVVTWSAMDYANKHNIPLFDLMGAGEPDVPYGVRDFKLQFGGALKEFGRFLNVNHNVLYKIGKIGMKFVN